MEFIRFNPVQRAELLRLGLLDSVIDHVETDGLPLGQYRLTREPRRGDVLDELRTVGKAIAEARTVIERLLNATRAVPHLWAARRQIPGGGRRHVMGGMRLNETSKSLATAQEVIGEAIAGIPSQPVRHRDASDFPIKAIYSAVQTGFAMAGQDPGAPGLKPSASPTSKFRRLIGICYAAIGAPTDDPDRAIKAYVKEWRKLDKYMATLNAAQDPRVRHQPRQVLDLYRGALATRHYSKAN